MVDERLARIQLHPTPGDAAMQGFPPAHCRVLAVDVDGKDAYVVLDTGPAEYTYLYVGAVEHVEGGWRGGSQSNGGGIGWSVTDQNEEVGLVAICDEAPVACDAVRVEWRGEVRETPVRNGVYLVTWFREPQPENEWPQVREFRIGGDWVGAHGLMGRGL